MSEEITEVVEPSEIETPTEDKPDETAVLLKKVENLAKENKNLIRSQQAMANQFNMMVESTVKQRIAELTAAKEQAIDEGDRGRVKAIEQQMEEVRAHTPKQTQTGLDPAIQNFVEANEWFNKDDEMTQFAIAFNESYLKKNPGNLEASLDKTLEAVKKAFPEKFETQKKTPPSPVEGATRANSGNKYSMSRLTEEQKAAYRQYVTVHKLMDHDQYFKSLEEAGYLA